MSQEWEVPSEWFRLEQELVSDSRERREAAGAVADLVQAEWVSVSLADRIAAAEGRQLSLRTLDGGTSTGVVTDVGRDWLVLRHGGWETFHRLSTVMMISGLGRGSQPAGSLTWASEGSVWRDWVARRRRCQWGLVDRRILTGSVVRVGQDALDVVEHPVDRAAVTSDGRVVLPLTAISWSRSRGGLDRD